MSLRLLQLAPLGTYSMLFRWHTGRHVQRFETPAALMGPCVLEGLSAAGLAAMMHEVSC